MDSPRWLADPNMTPDQKAEADELEHAIQHCLNNLPLEFKTVVVMADIQGMDYTEVATCRASASWDNQKPPRPCPIKIT